MDTRGEKLQRARILLRELSSLDVSTLQVPRILQRNICPSMHFPDFPHAEGTSENQIIVVLRPWSIHELPYRHDWRM